MATAKTSLAQAKEKGWTKGNEYNALVDYSANVIFHIILVVLALYGGGAVLKSRALNLHLRKANGIAENVTNKHNPLLSIIPGCFANQTFEFPSGSKTFCAGVSDNKITTR